MRKTFFFNIADSESPATTEPPYCEPRACGRGKFWRPAPYCSCWVGCDFIRECAQGLKWDIFACGCIEACPDTKCRKNFIPDAETCECQCSLSSSDCSDGTTFDPLNCRCVSNPTTTPGCPHVVTCPNGKHWDESVCDCVKDENCKVQACGKPKVWSPKLCKCVCSPKSCGKGKVQGSDCECVPETACPDIECFENFVLNPQSCECDCALTDEDCTGPLAYLDFNSCQCRRHPCDPPWPCPEGEIIDWEICNCAPDPNLTTKIPKSRESKSRENSKKSRESRSWRSSSDENRSRKQAGGSKPKK